MSDDAAEAGQRELHEAPGLAPDANGVDRAQIERMLDLSPIERVRVLEGWVQGIEELRALLHEADGLDPAR